MRNKRNRRGFTMAEMLIVVAIIGVLGAVSFIAVTQHERSLNRIERDAAAKEIFIAAQNHLTMAESQGFLGVTDFGTAEKTVDSAAKEGVYYLISSDTAGADMLDLMLPFGAIDEMVRTGGSYVIRYDQKNAIIMDVFYCSKHANKFNHKFTAENVTATTYQGLLALADEGTENERSNYGSDGAVLGWYGGEEAQNLTVEETPLKEPEIEIINKETLLVAVNDGSGNNASLKLIVTGKTSGVQKDFLLKTNETGKEPASVGRIKNNLTLGEDTYAYEIILDDITNSGMHFADLIGILIDPTTRTSTSAGFLPGEDITIQAVAYDNTKLTNIAYSAERVTNSLFERKETDASTDSTVYVNNFRHLENLHREISNVDNVPAGNETLKIRSAVQTTDLNWQDFVVHTGTSPVQFYNNGTSVPATTNKLFVPVSPYNELSYDGKEHSITGIPVNYPVNYSANPNDNLNPSGCAGLFGTSANPLSLSNLVLINFEIQGASHSGALAGELTEGSSVTNVLAYNSVTYDQTTGNKYENIKSTGGSAGGLIGSITGGAVKGSAAAVYVSGDTNAGGLIGTATNTAISGSYSGGHTLEGVYSDNTDPDAADGDDSDDPADDNGLVNVIGGTDAGDMVGGLVGSMTGTASLDHCYSTCSVYGATAGGLIGSATGSVSNSYAAGLVVATVAANAHTFIGSGTPTIDTCYYVAGINGAMASGNDTVKDSILPFGNNNDTNGHPIALPNEAARGEASPYDTTLVSTFGGKYAYPTLALLGYEHTDSNSDSLDINEQQQQSTTAVSMKRTHLTRHYGDWQMPVMDLDLVIDNSEYLTAKVTMPNSQIANYTQNWSKLDLYMLVKGVTSGEEAYLVFSLTQIDPSSDQPAYQLTLDVDEFAMDGLEFASDTEKTAWLNAWLNGASASLPTPETSTDTLFTIDFDKITSPLGYLNIHFAQLFPSFIPGEDLIVAVAAGFSNQAALENLIATPEKWSVVLSGQNGAAYDATEDGKSGAHETNTQPTGEQSPDSDAEGNAVANANETVVRSVVAETNSLFADPRITDANKASIAPTEYTDLDHSVVAIANFRHLENLDGTISGVNPAVNNSNDQSAAPTAQTGSTPNEGEGESPAGSGEGGETTAQTTISFNKAIQIKDLSLDAEDATIDRSWQGFIAAIKARLPSTVPEDKRGGIKVIMLNTTDVTPDNLYLPVNPNYALTYDGQNHSITGVKVSTSGDAGLFGTLNIENSSVSNLELIDFSITSTTGSAGALAGTVDGTTISVTNVLAHNDVDTDDSTRVNVTTGGNAGGLIGTMDGTTIEKCAAALVVQSTGTGMSAGGLVGASDGGEISASYSGGHTVDGMYAGGNSATHNVTAQTNAGGLVGLVENTDISESYSTCSVKGSVAGGFAGKVSGTGTIEKCYATGLVHIPADTDGNPVTTNLGAFAGEYNYSGSTSGIVSCWYYDIINEYNDTVNGGYTSLPALGSGGPNGNVVPFDGDAATYNAFVGPNATDPLNLIEEKTWTDVVSTITAIVEEEETEVTVNHFYDDILGTYYQNTYPLRTVEQLSASVNPETLKDAEGKVTAYADFVATHYGDWPAPEIFVENVKP